MRHNKLTNTYVPFTIAANIMLHKFVNRGETYGSGPVRLAIVYCCAGRSPVVLVIAQITLGLVFDNCRDDYDGLTCGF